MTDSQPQSRTQDATGGSAGTGVGSGANEAAGAPVTITIPAPDFPPVRDRKTGNLKPVNPWLNANHRGHRIPEAKKIAAWREAATRAAEGFAPMRTPVHITAHIFKPRRGIYDPNNLNVTSKACVDALVSCGILAADDYHHVLGPDHRHGGVGDPALVLTITELQGDLE